jgi:MFS family permease
MRSGFSHVLGGVLFGHFGDRIGRKVMLMLTMTIMALGTFAVGLLPTYDQIGILAPILLVSLRLLQGIGLGGEWNGASLMVLEHAPQGRRGIFGSLVQVGFPLGLVTSYGVFALATTMIPQTDFISWGWRVPFLLSIVLLGVGWFVRARLPETSLFEEIKRRREIAKNPSFEVIFRNTKTFLIAVGLKISEVSWVYVLTIFVVVYATTKPALPRQLLLNAIFIAALVEVITIPLFGWLSDTRPPDFLFHRNVVYSLFYFSTVLVAPHERPTTHRSDYRRSTEFGSWNDVWSSIDILSRTIRHTGALHWYFLRLPGCRCTRWRIIANYCDGIGWLHGRHGWRIRDANPPGGYHLHRHVGC